MDILLIEPFFTGSHQKWAEGLQAHSKHNLYILSLPGRHWKWRMHGAAITLSQQYLALNRRFDLILATDMLDVATFKGLCAQAIGTTPVVMYFHENQLTYPWSPLDEDVALQRDRHYGFINYTSALAADQCFFNSIYHHQSFTSALADFLQAFPDHKNLGTIEQIKENSQVLPLGMALNPLLEVKRSNDDYKSPVLLWNHRWEYDKNPSAFFELCERLRLGSISFKMIVCGERNRKYPTVFDQAKATFKDHLLHWGYAADLKGYHRLLALANILPVTSNQDFFGGSVVEAIAAGCLPLLPDRLAYPEHVPAHLHNQFLYKDLDQAISILSNPSWTSHSMYSQALRDHISAYDWPNIIDRYDAALTAVSR